MMVYEGAALEHWREPFTGENHAQILGHYVDEKGPYGKSMRYDGRKMLGIQLFTK